MSCPAATSIHTFFSWLGMIQRTKLGLVFLSVAISLASCSLYSSPTVRNMPFRVLKAPGSAVSDMPATWSKPMIRSTVKNIKLVECQCHTDRSEGTRETDVKTKRSQCHTIGSGGTRQERQTSRQKGWSVWSCRALLIRAEKCKGLWVGQT